MLEERACSSRIGESNSMNRKSLMGIYPLTQVLAVKCECFQYISVFHKSVIVFIVHQRSLLCRVHYYYSIFVCPSQSHGHIVLKCLKISYTFHPVLSYFIVLMTHLPAIVIKTSTRKPIPVCDVSDMQFSVQFLLPRDAMHKRGLCCHTQPEITDAGV